MRQINTPDRRHYLPVVRLLIARYLPENDSALFLAVLIPFAVMLWSHWLTMVGLFRSWQTNSDYSVGQLVPLVAGFFLWRERRHLRLSHFQPCWWGLGVLLLAEAVRTYGVLSLRFSLERYALVLTAGGLLLTVGGRQVFRKTLWILLFLSLMIPLPGQIHDVISSPLQTLATTGAVFCLEACGTYVTQQGNVVMLDDSIPVAVAEACGGLRMLTAFIVVAAFIAFMVKRPRWEKGILLVSSIPVAVACNIFRIFLTAVIMLHVDAEVGAHFFHDFAGIIMMPAAISLLFSELWLMDRLIVPRSCEQTTIAGTKSRPRDVPRVVFARNRQQAT